MNKLTYMILAIFLALSFSSLSMAAIESGVIPEEMILGYSANKLAIYFRVSSGGCTKPGDFTVQVKPGKIAELSLYRVRPDTCLSYIPTGIQISLTYEKIGISPSQPFVITNKNGVVRGWIWDD